MIIAETAPSRLCHIRAPSNARARRHQTLLRWTRTMSRRRPGPRHSPYPARAAQSDRPATARARESQTPRRFKATVTTLVELVAASEQLQQPGGRVSPLLLCSRHAHVDPVSSALHRAASREKFSDESHARARPQAHPPAHACQPGGLSAPIAGSVSHIGCSLKILTDPGCTNALTGPTARYASASWPGSSGPWQPRWRGRHWSPRQAPGGGLVVACSGRRAGAVPCQPWPRVQ